MSLIITQNYFLKDPFTDEPLSNARIGYKTLWRADGASVSASSEQAGFPVSSTTNELTYEFWRPQTLPASWDLNLTTPGVANYLGIASHSLDGSKIKLQVNNGGWQDITQFFLVDDKTPIMILFDRVTSTQFRILIEDGEIPSIGVVFIGETLEMQRPIYGGHSPINLSRQTTISGNISERGQWLGRSLVREGVETSFSFENLTAEWYRENFDPFAEYATQAFGTFFIAWRPIKYPKEVGYCWTNSDIKPNNSSKRDLMDVDFNVQGQLDFTSPKREDYA